jgi:glycosyltransferase involved in cell wall biosynthesis
MPKLSIITINFNNAEGLKKTVESVLNQSSKDFEYIVIDGASTDGSLEIIRQYKDKITHCISEKDTGIYNAMNKGILKAQGEYCQFLNSGDCLINDRVIETMISALPDCGVFYGNMLKTLNKKIYINKKVDTHSLLTFYRGTLNHSPAFIKRTLFDKYGLYDEKLKIVSDWKFFLIAIGLNNEKVQYIDLDVTCFDMTGISNTNSALDKKERRQVLEEYLPENVLADYDKYWLTLEQINRLNKYKLLKQIVWLMERIAFKFEKTNGQFYIKEKNKLS